MTEWKELVCQTQRSSRLMQLTWLDEAYLSGLSRRYTVMLSLPETRDRKALDQYKGVHDGRIKVWRHC